MNLPAPAREIAAIARRYSLTYNTLSKAVHAARRHLGLKPPGSAGRRLPKLLTASQLASFYESIDKADNLQHQIMLRLLFFTGARVAELCAIKISDVDLTAGRIYILQGKGEKDRYVIFPNTFALSLKAYNTSVQDATEGKQVYLFESRQRRQFSTRRVQQIVTQYAEAAGIKANPHLFRHQCLTWLTKSGLSDSQIQLISGHSSKKSLERYQHLALGDVTPAYQDAMRKIEL